VPRRWNPRPVRRRRAYAGRGWPTAWTAFRSRRVRLSLSEVALTLLLGLALGLAAPYWQARWLPGSDPFAGARPETPNPWAESLRSRAILEPQEGAPAPASASPSRPATWASDGIVDVIDGDTFDYRGERIRIADIDTPETHPARCAHEAQLGERATQRLAELLGQGPFLLQAADRDEDRYGRKLRIVTRDGRSLGGVLVAEGLARPWEGRRRSWCG
jgi:endonuclease YncB( thermonuclease family)